MNNYLLKIKKLISKSGLILFLLRLPFRASKVIAIKLNSFFWKFFLKECGNNVVIELSVNFENPKNVILNDNVYIGANSRFGSELNDGTITIESNVHIGRNCTIDHTGSITIKENTLLSENIKILSHSHGYDPRSKPIGLELIIEKNCWIGLNTIITENCNFINSSNITASGSIVTKNLNEPNCVYGGLPAKKIKRY